MGEFVVNALLPVKIPMDMLHLSPQISINYLLISEVKIVKD